jgi:phage-related minor tail protein
MANQITIDIVAQTQKLTSGINDANSQIDGMSSKLKGAAAAATAAASAFVLKQGVSFLKDGITEAEDARKAMNDATSAFGAGSTALQKITTDAEKFGKALGIDNDDILKLSTALGSRLPADAKALSAELVNTAKDVEAVTAGAVSAEAVTSKLAKAFADGVITAKELTKIFPDLSKATYDQAEQLSKAGKNQEALTLLIDAAQKKYGDAAEKNVTATQKFDTALANLKEQIGTKVLPIVESFIDKLTILIEWFGKQPQALQNIELGLAAIVAIGGPFLGFLASAKTALQVLGITTGEYTIAQRLANFTIMGFPGLWVIAAITAVIAIIVLLVKNWDTITAVVGKVWEKIKDFATDAWDALKSFGSKVAGFIQGIKDKFGEIPGQMLSIGKNIAMGLWDGISSMAGWLKNRIFDFFGSLIPGWAKKMLGIASPSKVFAGFGENIVQGLAQGINAAENIAKTATLSLGNATVSGFRMPSLSTGTSTAPIAITINAGLGTNGPALGRQVSSAIKQYGKVSSQVAF